MYAGLISDCGAQFFRYELKLTSPEVDLLWSKLPVEKDGTVSFEELVQYCFLNFNVAAPGGEEAGSGECIAGETFFLWLAEHTVCSLYIVYY